MICEKCGKQFPDTLLGPIRCLCSGNKIVDFKFEKTQQDTDTPIFSLIELQRKLWEELHTYKWISEEETKIWFNFFCLRVPCGECRVHWSNLISEFPPDFSSQNSFFEWGVEAHNKVNKRLGKPQISLDDAKRLWIKP